MKAPPFESPRNEMDEAHRNNTIYSFIEGTIQQNS